MSPANAVATPSPASERWRPGSFTKSRPTTLFVTMRCPMCSVMTTSEMGASMTTTCQSKRGNTNGGTAAAGDADEDRDDAQKAAEEHGRDHRDGERREGDAEEVRVVGVRRPLGGHAHGDAGEAEADDHHHRPDDHRRQQEVDPARPELAD